MIKFWTFQHKCTLEELCRSGIYYPDFDKTCQYEGRRPAYNYIRDNYKHFNEDTRLRGRAIKGLVFGVTEYKGNPINTYDEYKHAIADFGAGGISTSVRDYYLLELHLPIEEQCVMSIDFYRFSDLIYYSSEEVNTKEFNGIDYDLDIVKSNLFKPNGINNTYELKQSHLGYISKRMIKNIYPAVDWEYKTEKFLYSICPNMEYYKKKLIIRGNEK